MGFSFHDAPSPGYRKVNEILTAGVGWIARSEHDRAHAHVTVIDVPAFLGGIGRAAAGELGHAPIEARQGRAGNRPALQPV